MSPKHGITPWRPNQHGAWAMLIAPAVAVTVPALHHFANAASTSSFGTTFSSSPSPGWRAALTVFAILIAWFFGYFCFFALSLVAKARTPQRRRSYAKPLYVYGPIAGLAMLGALILQRGLLIWALFFTPLMTIALWETFHGRPRSMTSGIATTVASALLVPVITMATYATSFGGIGSKAWLCFAFLGLYFSGTVPLVKSMVRERKTPGFTQFSVLFHAGCAIAFAAIVVALLTTQFHNIFTATGFSVSGHHIIWQAGLMELVLIVAALRAWWIPFTAAHGQTWTAKRIGMWEIPLVVTSALIVMVTLW